MFWTDHAGFCMEEIWEEVETWSRKWGAVPRDGWGGRGRVTGWRMWWETRYGGNKRDGGPDYGPKESGGMPMNLSPSPYTAAKHSRLMESHRLWSLLWKRLSSRVLESSTGGDFLGSPVAETPCCNAGVQGLIPARGTRSYMLQLRVHMAQLRPSTNKLNLKTPPDA